MNTFFRFAYFLFQIAFECRRRFRFTMRKLIDSQIHLHILYYIISLYLLVFLYISMFFLLLFQNLHYINKFNESCEILWINFNVYNGM